MSASESDTRSRDYHLGPVLVNPLVLRALRIQIAIPEVRAHSRRGEDLEPLLVDVEALLLDLVRDVRSA